MTWPTWPHSGSSWLHVKFCVFKARHGIQMVTWPPQRKSSKGLPCSTAVFTQLVAPISIYAVRSLRSPMKFECAVQELSQLTTATISLQWKLWMGKWKIVSCRSTSSAATEVSSKLTLLNAILTKNWSFKTHKMRRPQIGIMQVCILGAWKPPQNCAGNVETNIVYSPCTAAGLQCQFKTPILKRYVFLHLCHRKNNYCLKCLKSYVSWGKKYQLKTYTLWSHKIFC